MNKYLISFLTIASALTVTSCSDDSRPATPVQAAVEVTLPEGFDLSDVSDARLSFYNVSNGSTTDFDVSGSQASVKVVPGFYNVSYSASVSLHDGVKGQLRAQQLGVTVGTDASALLKLTAFAHVPSDDLIISELYYTGSLKNNGDQYNGDQYLKLYNNTDHVIYADGLAIIESAFLTTQKYDYTPDVLNEAVTVDAIYLIPGAGTDVPVAPGESLLIADVAVNHKDINPYSIDLSGADFEWYDVSSDPKTLDIDNPAVPNLDKWYSYTRSVWQLHNRGFKAYGLARIPVGREEYFAQYRYTYEYENVTEAGSFPMSRIGYKIPNEWIVDMVNTSVPSVYVWNVNIPALDMGWAYCGEIDNDKKRYFHAVRRAFEGEDADGRIMLRDTNNSSVDFHSYVYPSVIEEQSAVIDIDGTQCPTLTIDGIIPVK